MWGVLEAKGREGWRTRGMALKDSRSPNPCTPVSQEAVGFSAGPSPRTQLAQGDKSKPQLPAGTLGSLQQVGTEGRGSTWGTGSDPHSVTSVPPKAGLQILPPLTGFSIQELLPVLRWLSSGPHRGRVLGSLLLRCSFRASTEQKSLWGLHRLFMWGARWHPFDPVVKEAPL